MKKTLNELIDGFNKLLALNLTRPVGEKIDDNGKRTVFSASQSKTKDINVFETSSHLISVSSDDVDVLFLRYVKIYCESNIKDFYVTSIYSHLNLMYIRNKNIADFKFAIKPFYKYIEFRDVGSKHIFKNSKVVSSLRLLDKAIYDMTVDEFVAYTNILKKSDDSKKEQFKLAVEASKVEELNDIKKQVESFGMPFETFKTLVEDFNNL